MKPAASARARPLRGAAANPPARTRPPIGKAERRTGPRPCSRGRSTRRPWTRARASHSAMGRVEPSAVRGRPRRAARLHALRATPRACRFARRPRRRAMLSRIARWHAAAPTAPDRRRDRRPRRGARRGPALTDLGGGAAANLASAELTPTESRRSCAPAAGRSPRRRLRRRARFRRVGSSAVVRVRRVRRDGLERRPRTA